MEDPGLGSMRPTLASSTISVDSCSSPGYHAIVAANSLEMFEVSSLGRDSRLLQEKRPRSSKTRYHMDSWLRCNAIDVVLRLSNLRNLTLYWPHQMSKYKLAFMYVDARLLNRNTAIFAPKPSHHRIGNIEYVYNCYLLHQLRSVVS